MIVEARAQSQCPTRRQCNLILDEHRLVCCGVRAADQAGVLQAFVPMLSAYGEGMVFADVKIEAAVPYVVVDRLGACWGQVMRTLVGDVEF